MKNYAISIKSSPSNHLKSTAIFTRPAYKLYDITIRLETGRFLRPGLNTLELRDSRSNTVFGSSIPRYGP